MLSSKRMCGYLFALLAVTQMAAFFLYSQTLAHVDVKWIVYLVYWIRTLAEATVPLLAATGAFLLHLHGHRRVFLFPILPVLSRVLYFMPDYYLYYLERGLDSAESLAMAAIITLLECAALCVFSLLLLWLAIWLFSRRPASASEEEKTAEGESPFSPFDLENPRAKSLFSISFAYFCLQTILEFIRTVSYLLENAGTYTLEEILTIAFSFLFHLAALFFSQLLCTVYFRYAEKRYARSAKEEN